ncbi:MAG: hypothetical protein V3V08_03940 [Nannocystaceae bacterium]
MGQGTHDRLRAQLVSLTQGLDDARRRGDAQALDDLRALADRSFGEEYSTLAPHLDRLGPAAVLVLLRPRTRVRAYVTSLALRSILTRNKDPERAKIQATRALELGRAVFERDAGAVRDTLLVGVLADIPREDVPRDMMTLWRELCQRVETSRIGYR